MSQALLTHSTPQNVLEIGTGSGYQTAILAMLFKKVWTIERIEPLLIQAKETLSKLPYHNIEYKLGDGSKGWKENAPYDGIIVTAAANEVPETLLQQLHPDGGVLVIPIGPTHKVQNLTLIKKDGNSFQQTILELVCFVPLIADPKQY
jgi:protein-L-isoaspartate(D-aspartate) O-methyltransferase